MTTPPLVLALLPADLPSPSELASRFAQAWNAGERQYEPTLLNGVPVPVIMTVTFSLQ